MTTTRNYSFDLARAICVLWIVGFWHLLNYLPPQYRLSEGSVIICKEITFSVLACFTFLSGFFLKKYRFESLNDVLFFYKKRFLRFYPLFVIATFCLIICGSTVKQILLADFGLSMLCPPPIQTLWYFSMLLLFYLCTPLLKLIHHNCSRLVLFVIFILAFIFYGYFFADIRLIMYFPFYILGLNLPNRFVEKLLNLYTFFISITIFIALCLINIDFLLLQIVQALAGVCFILSLSKLIYRDGIKKPIAFIAEASMCAYLFHRPLYTIITQSLRRVSSYDYMPVIIAVIAIFILFIIAQYVQKTYNQILNKIVKNGE